ncbi:hypothetical protein VTL71DRAFT_15800 [Oculimacula yallundae]|uniref:2EXR domain-containing protein n=1 Tax=Oculimacula yallundae TaxID=86028 RepID=A0ABR4CCM7_9HELO
MRPRYTLHSSNNSLRLNYTDRISSIDDMANQSKLYDTWSNLDSFYHDLPDRRQGFFAQPLSSFPIMRLPVELRLMIWRFTIPRGRKIWLHPQRQKDDKTRASLRIPVLTATQVCFESRQEIYRYLNVSLRSYTPICINRFDIIRCEFKLLLRVDARHEEYLDLILRRREVVDQVRELEIKMDDFSHIDELLLLLSCYSVFRPFVRLEKLRLLVPAGVDWKESCETHFEKVCRGIMSEESGTDHPILVIEEI